MNKYERRRLGKLRLKRFWKGRGAVCSYPVIQFLTKERDCQGCKWMMWGYCSTDVSDEKCWCYQRGKYIYYERPSVPHKIVATYGNRSGKKFYKKYANSKVRNTKGCLLNGSYRKYFDMRD